MKKLLIILVLGMILSACNLPIAPIPTAIPISTNTPAVELIGTYSPLSGAKVVSPTPAPTTKIVVKDNLLRIETNETCSTNYSITTANGVEIYADQACGTIEWAIQQGWILKIFGKEYILSDPMDIYTQ